MKIFGIELPRKASNQGETGAGVQMMELKKANQGDCFLVPLRLIQVRDGLSKGCVATFNRPINAEKATLSISVPKGFALVMKTAEGWDLMDGCGEAQGKLRSDRRD